ncbi:hypothetical protein T440DRAFT_552607 [Plenodomus tracheiphilus IPT5]|uniref:DUF7728 domain-containing protein n=1 Tax=Plenodomus tracheiphilus IPT5 TaxID=1408161 RepID=A0A6A7BF11_9PLEO|nr:hypothetical protein T440DRAFT_552607 [Plenodomus tracheiphilus IPT5]
MSPSKLGIFASLALATSAVLIPPSITTEELGDDKALAGLVIDPFSRAVTLDCPGCPFASLKGDSYKWTHDVGNAFRLDLEIGDETTFKIDDVQLFPPNLSVNTIHVTQIDPSSEEDLRLRVTGYQFRYNGAETVSETGTELLPVTFRIIRIEDVPVQLPELNINLLKDTEGRLMIASFDMMRPVEEASPIDELKECNEWPLLCKWKSILADRIERMKKMGKGCHKRPHGHGHSNPMMEETTEGKPPHRFQPGKPHHRPHHRHGRVQTFLRRAFFTILIPIVIGIFAGTVTYLIGMALGCLIAITIAKIRGQGYQRIALEDDVEEADEDAEKQEYAELPAYEAPPVYDEAAEKEVVDTK